MVTESTAASLPKQDQDLLTTFIAVRFNLIELATHTRSPLLALQDWALQPQIQAQIARYRALEKLQHQTQAADARAAGIDTLLALLTESPDPIERRRAAQTLIRVGADAQPDSQDEEDPNLSADEEFDRDLEEEEQDDPEVAHQAPAAPILSLTPHPIAPPPEIPPTFTLAPHHNGEHSTPTSQSPPPASAI